MKKLHDKEVLISQKSSFKNVFFFIISWNVSRDKKSELAKYYRLSSDNLF